MSTGTWSHFWTAHWKRKYIVKTSPEKAKMKESSIFPPKIQTDELRKEVPENGDLRNRVDLTCQKVVDPQPRFADSPLNSDNLDRIGSLQEPNNSMCRVVVGGRGRGTEWVAAWLLVVLVVVLVVAQSTEHQGQAGLYWGEGGGREFRGDKVRLRGRGRGNEQRPLCLKN